MFTEPKFYVQFTSSAQQDLILMMARQWDHVADTSIVPPHQETVGQTAGDRLDNWLGNNPQLDPDKIIVYPGFIWFYRKNHMGRDETWHNCRVYFRAIQDLLSLLSLQGKI